MKIRGLAQASLDLLEPQIAENARDETLAVFTTLRYDRRLTELTRRIPIAMEDSYNDTFFLARLHYQRLKYSSQLFQWPELKYHQFCNALDEAVADFKESTARIRVEYNAQGVLRTVVSPVPQRDNLFSGLSDTPVETESQDPIFDAVLDTEQTPTSLFSFIKTNKRAFYDEARARHNIALGATKEVLLFNEKDEITEGSISSVAVLIDGQWVTPPAEETMNGVLRSFLINLGFVKEGPIHKSLVKPGVNVLLFNGVIGVVKGIVKAP
ncbi:Putative aminodeoxychorismate lyase [Wickerhamiella sorbophila]|uniref:Aminodeoxychorismate lyase n=1 Tax=Wickerhamiella sorbophila TaxID=45607 RepID=A0A2T0FJ41_9ASCO|nr:Putative aminodeoxychorismate lyase [Wickerhamiella sorbophila]PRT54967.1 Putative aminodeoxychorismate lyase [Wickerhamiella sorbophila]